MSKILKRLENIRKALDNVVIVKDIVNKSQNRHAKTLQELEHYNMTEPNQIRKNDIIKYASPDMIKISQSGIVVSINYDMAGLTKKIIRSISIKKKSGKKIWKIGTFNHIFFVYDSESNKQSIANKIHDSCELMSHNDIKNYIAKYLKIK
jgi:hypothetical protein